MPNWVTLHVLLGVLAILDYWGNQVILSAVCVQF